MPPSGRSSPPRRRADEQCCRASAPPSGHLAPHLAWHPVRSRAVVCPTHADGGRNLPTAAPSRLGLCSLSSARLPYRVSCPFTPPLIINVICPHPAERIRSVRCLAEPSSTCCGCVCWLMRLETSPKSQQNPRFPQNNRDKNPQDKRSRVGYFSFLAAASGEAEGRSLSLRRQLLPRISTVTA